ncbi:winged helix-turn-helix domain-containing protein [Thalassotalea sp. PS06]|uniref:winged helix-turn-helix domain-containing protein n=1 Tax=Thalassotalea sp. PS06 TaxID=2594005 RepID=UPI0011633016|nr:winged helix-turn-helix domain-containing protein [Thalassotalea sp. PS06]QDP00228.1 hypothetical protein FNC98_01995 [Thalassotalea sp. PS06]
MEEKDLFEKWTFKAREALLVHESGESIIMEAKIAKLLMYFLANPNKVITRDELLEHVWDKRIVSDYTINSTISELRKLLNIEGSKERNKYIKTHPKIGYSFVAAIKTTIEKEQSQPPVAKENKLTEKIIALSLFFITLLVFVFFVGNSHPENIEITGKKFLSYKDGQISYPSISSDKKYISYIRMHEGSGQFQLVIKDFKSTEILYESDVEENITSVGFAKGTKDIFIQKHESDSCELYKVAYTHENKFEFRETAHLVSCGSNIITSPISNLKNKIYFSGKVNEDIGINIYELDINTGEIESKTGDIHSTDFNYFHHLNKDDLLIVRKENSKVYSLVKLNLSDGVTKSLHTVDYPVFSAFWLDENQIVFPKKEELMVFDLKTNKESSFLTLDDRISFAELIAPEELLVVEGRSLKNNIYHGLIGKGAATYSQVISSSFLDKEPVMNKHNQIAFTSNRTGVSQIYLKSKEKLTQLTSYDEDKNLSNLSFSNDGENLLFIKNFNVFTLNIQNLVIKPIHTFEGKVMSAVFACDGRAILYTIHSKGLTNLYLNQEGKVSLINSNVDLVKSDCLENKYAGYLTGDQLIKIFNSSMKLEDVVKYKAKHEISSNNSWEYSNGKLYFASAESLLKFDMDTDEIENINLPFKGVWNFSLYDDSILFSKHTANNSHVSSYTLKRH